MTQKMKMPLKNEDVPKNEDNPKSEDNPKNGDNPKMKMTPKKEEAPKILFELQQPKINKLPEHKHPLLRAWQLLSKYKGSFIRFFSSKKKNLLPHCADFFA